MPTTTSGPIGGDLAPPIAREPETAELHRRECGWVRRESCRVAAAMRSRDSAYWSAFPEKSLRHRTIHSGSRARSMPARSRRAPARGATPTWRASPSNLAQQSERLPAVRSASPRRSTGIAGSARQWKTRGRLRTFRTERCDRAPRQSPHPADRLRRDIVAPAFGTSSSRSWWRWHSARDRQVAETRPEDWNTSTSPVWVASTAIVR